MKFHKNRFEKKQVQKVRRYNHFCNNVQIIFSRMNYKYLGSGDNTSEEQRILLFIFFFRYIYW
jgi:hypothetical protein